MALTNETQKLRNSETQKLLTVDPWAKFFASATEEALSGLAQFLQQSGTSIGAGIIQSSAENIQKGVAKVDQGLQFETEQSTEKNFNAIGSTEFMMLVKQLNRVKQLFSEAAEWKSFGDEFFTDFINIPIDVLTTNGFTDEILANYLAQKNQ